MACFILREIFGTLYDLIYFCSVHIRAALTTHELELLELRVKLAELELKCSNRELVYVGYTNVTQSTKHPLLTYITAYHCHVFFTIANVYIQAVLSVIMTFVPHQHVLKHGNVNKAPPMQYLFFNSWAGK